VSAVIASWSHDENRLTCGITHQSQTIMHRRLRSSTDEREQNAESTSLVKVMNRNSVNAGVCPEGQRNKSP